MNGPRNGKMVSSPKVKNIKVAGAQWAPHQWPGGTTKKNGKTVPIGRYGPLGSTKLPKA